MCEIKYWGGDSSVDKAYYKTLFHQQGLLEEEVSPRVSVHSTLITTFDLAQNGYSGVYTNVITLEELFAAFEINETNATGPVQPRV